MSSEISQDEIDRLLTDDGEVDARLTNSGPDNQLTPDQCAEIRTRLIEDQGPVQKVIDDMGLDLTEYGPQTHYRGDCDCDHGVPPVVFRFEDRRWTVRDGGDHE